MRRGHSLYPNFCQNPLNSHLLPPDSRGGELSQHKAGRRDAVIVGVKMFATVSHRESPKDQPKIILWFLILIFAIVMCMYIHFVNV